MQKWNESEIKKYCDVVWIRYKKPTYYPKFSKKVLKSCDGCALAQKLITTKGAPRSGGSKHYACTSESMIDNTGKGICALNFLVEMHGISESGYRPKERCLKPRTSFQYVVCNDITMKFSMPKFQDIEGL